MPMIESATIRKAKPDEATVLSALAVRSKAHWGYSMEFIEACREELSMTTEDINQENNYYVVAETREAVIGFYALIRESSGEVQLGALFVDPVAIGMGVGRTLMKHAKDKAVTLGAQILSIQSDPHAEKFYLAAGAELIGQKESGSIQGRFLPMLKISLLDTASNGDR